MCSHNWRWMQRKSRPTRELGHQCWALCEGVGWTSIEAFHPQVTGRCVHKLLGQAQVASAIIASRVSWSFSLGNYSFNTDSAILFRAEKRFSKLSQTSMVGYHHHWKNQEQVPITVLAGKGTGCTLRCCICTPTVKGMMAITHWQKRWRASELKADFTPKILNSYKLRREVPTYK